MSDRGTEFGRVRADEAEGRHSAADITLFDSTGLAIQELAIVIAAYATTGGLDAPTIERERRDVRPVRRQWLRTQSAARRAGSKRSRNGASSPRIAFAASCPHAKPSTLPWPE